MIRLVFGFAAIFAGSACQQQYRPTAPPPPLRPEPEPVPTAVEQKDCEPTDPQTERRPLSFNERSIPEGRRLADLGNVNLNGWRNPEVPRITREQQLTDAVKAFITALAADPYNVRATYGLAAAYARIGRTQCSINLLTRILQMRPHTSKRTEVEQYIDHLLGRRRALDPDFMDMRRDERFRRLIQKMCEGSSDPNCVYGAKKLEDDAAGAGGPS
jgi:tetratricopeptide (TPR) repeat protein